MSSVIHKLRPYPWATYLLIVINITIYAVIELSGASTLNIYDLLDWGANLSPLTFKDQWWRLITSMFLHIGFIHLMVNMLSLYSLGKHVETIFGHRAFIITYLITGLIAGLTSGYFNMYIVSAGASGAIFGIYGFHIVQVLSHSWENRNEVLKTFLSFAAYVAIITWVGTKANFDNAAHMGGLFSGILIALTDVQFNRSRAHRIYQLVLVIGLAIVVIGYVNMPQYKVAYYEMFQAFIKAENQTVSALNKDYASDTEMAADLSQTLQLWDSARATVDALPPLPEALQSDSTIVNEHIGLRKAELNYLITAIGEESYIYMDSLDIVRGEMHNEPPLQYVLNYNRPTEEQQQDSVNQQEPSGTLVTVYYDSLWRECPVWDSQYYRRGFKDSLGRWNGFVRDFYKSDKIQMKGHYDKDLRDGIFLYYNENDTYSAAGRYVKDDKVGKWQYFYESGIMSSEVRYRDWAYTLNTWDSVGQPMVVDGEGEDVHKYKNGVIADYARYKDGRIEGEAYGYHKDGSPYYREYYQDGRLVHGYAISQKGERSEYDIATFIPHPQVGADAFRNYLTTEKQYPEAASKNGITGDLTVIFTVYPDGTIGDFRFTNRLGYGCEAEAKRLLKNGPLWVPAYIHGLEPVTSESQVSISFP